MVINQSEVKANGEPDDSFITNHFLRAVRAQARNGVGTDPTMLPAAFAAHLCDRAFGKESEKLAVRSPGKPFEGLTGVQLAARMAELSRSVEPTEH